MPTEHEFKYVIAPKIFEEEKELTGLLSFGWDARKIHQGYLPVRIRRVEELIHRYDTKYWFTFKRKINNRMVEIETEIDERDWSDLWDLTTERLIKKRYSFLEETNDPNQKRYKWELDIFYHNGEPYFALMELEMKEGLGPRWMNQYMKDFVIFEVPLTDERFSSKRLSDVAYAKMLYKEVINGKELQDRR